MEFLFEYGLFLAKVITFSLAIIVVLVIAKTVSKPNAKGELEITNLTEKHKDLVKNMENHIFDDADLKIRDKAEKKAAKKKQKEEKNKAKNLAEDKSKDQEDSQLIKSDRSPYLFVIDFSGSIDAKEVTSLREEITAVLSIAKLGDEVVVRLESPGGMVHAYGLASSQLDRLKQANIPLTIVVDKVAASGGYMMACVADKIIAAPFAIIGSIGVIAQLPNFNKLLKKNDIEFEQLTAGEFKRTLTMFGENTEKAREKFQSELEETHVLFKDFIAEHRPALALDKVATGEHWYGKQAIELGLIDAVGTSDDYLISEINKDEKQVISLKFVRRKTFADKISGSAAGAVDRLLLKWINRGQRPIV